MLDTEGRLLPASIQRSRISRSNFLRPRRASPAVVDLLASYQIERHIRQDKDEGVNRLKKEVLLNPEFQPVGPDQAKDAVSRRVRNRRTGAAGRGADQEDGQDRGRQDSRYSRSGRRCSRWRHDNAISAAEEQVTLATALCPTCWPNSKTKPN